MNVSEKACTRCGVVKPLTEFWRKGDARYNRVTYQAHCKDCGREINAVQREKRKLRFASLPDNAFAGVTKQCISCGQEKPLEAFWRHNEGAYGRHPRCIECQSAAMKTPEKRAYARDWMRAKYQRDPEHARAQEKRWREQNPARLSMLQHRYYKQRRARRIADGTIVPREKKTPEQKRQRHIAYNTAYRAAHKEQHKAYYLTYYPAHRRQYLDAYLRRRARKRNAPRVERIYRAALIERDNSICYICGELCTEGVDLTLDHVIPLVRGGTHTADNLRVCCETCNKRKGPKLLEELFPRGSFPLSHWSTPSLWTIQSPQ